MELKNIFIYFLNFTDSAMEGGGEQQREGKREGGEPQAGSMLSAEPNTGFDPMTPGVMTWAEIKSLMLNWLSAPGHLSKIFLNDKNTYRFYYTNKNFSYKKEMYMKNM